MNSGKPDRVGQVFAALGKSVCYVSLFLGMQIAVMLPAFFSILAQALKRGQVLDEDDVNAMLSADAMTLTLISGLLTIVIVLAFYLIRRKKLGEALMLRRVSAPALLASSSLVPALYLLVTIGLLLLPETWLESYSEASEGIGGGTLIGVLAVAVVAPVVEEFIFRGLMMNRLSQVMPGWLAVALSAAVFGACHGHPVWFAYAFVLGLFFGFIDLRAGSIWPSILGHLIFNAIGQVFSFIPETEEGTEVLVALGVLVLAGIALPVISRRGVAALFRPAPKPLPEPPAELSAQPGIYEYDPWDE